MELKAESKAAVLAALAFALTAAAAEIRYEASRAAMGTTFTIVAYGPGEEQLQSAAEEAFQEIERLDELLSNYKPHSELSELNRRAGRGTVRVTRDLFTFLEVSDRYRRETWGAFDITLGNGAFRLHARSSTAELVGSRTKLDPGGIGKGFAVDWALEILKAAGIERAFISAGTSTIYALGSPPGEKGWRVSVRSPQDKAKAVVTLALKDASISTSAAYERGLHIVDPRTHRPATGVESASAIAPTGTESDALSTAFFVLGPERTRAYLRAHPQVRAFLCAPECRWVKP